MALPGADVFITEGNRCRPEGIGVCAVALSHAATEPGC